jgi:hypothetical protein
VVIIFRKIYNTIDLPEIDYRIMTLSYIRRAALRCPLLLCVGLSLALGILANGVWRSSLLGFRAIKAIPHTPSTQLAPIGK